MFPLRRTRVSGGARVARAEAVLHDLGLRGVARKYPWQLSGGMAQRVAIARALVSRPRLLLLDEPFASVDALTREELQDVVLRVHGELERRMTVVQVTHDIDEAVYLGDRVLILSSAPGRVRRLDRGRHSASALADREPQLTSIPCRPERNPRDRQEAAMRRRQASISMGRGAARASRRAGSYGSPASGSRSWSPRAGPTRPAPTTVNITALPIEPTALSFYAKALGFFSREGIDARITVINDPQQAPAAVLSARPRSRASA